MKGALFKDFIREIRGNKGRFLSIFFIVLLGAAFFSGIRSAGGQMRYSGDAFFDESDLMDIRVLSTLGLTDDDLEVIRSVEGVELAVGGYTKEALIPAEGQQYTVKLIAQTDEINRTTIKEGRSPQKPNECVIDHELMEMLGCSLGDTLSLTSGTEDPLSDSLKETEFVIVGSGSIPYYLDLTRGVGTIGDGTLSGFLVTLPEVFDTDIYTEVYVRIAGAEELNSYGDEYKELSEKVVDRIEAVSDEARQRRYDEIYTEGTDQIEEGKQEIADAEKELADAKAELDDGKAELDDAKTELEDGEKELKDAEAELEDGRKQLEDAKKELDDGEAELADAKAELDKGEAELADAKAELDKGEAELADAKAELDNGAAQLADSKKQLDAAAAQLADSKAQLDAGEAELADAKAELDAGEAQLAESKEQLDEAEAELKQAKQEIEEGEKELAAGKEELDAAKEELDAAGKELEDGKADLEKNKALIDQMRQELDKNWKLYENQKQRLINAGMTEDQAEAMLAEARAKLEESEAAYHIYLTKWEAGKAEYEAGLAEYNEGKAKYEAGLAEYETHLAELEAGKAKYEAGLAEFEEGKAKYEAGAAKLEEGKAQYEAGLAEWKDGKRQYEAGLAAYEDGKAQYEAGLAEWEDGRAQYEAGLAEWEDGKRQYEDGLAEWEDGKRQYEDGLAEWKDGKKKYEEALADYEDGKKQYEDAVKEYNDGLKEYNDGLAEWEEGNEEYQDAYADAQKEIAKAKVDISKAEKDLAELGVPTWYILDREKISSCVSFGMDADRMDSLGNVFPVIFFLVAALVSLTAMTRMVEEQRQQIGTLKALGYSNGSVAAKYFGYAMLATITGACLGIWIGEWVLPWVILDAYCSALYTGMPGFFQPFNWQQGIMAVVLSTACTGIATLAACYRKLKDKPAELMRPEAPKSGKRILLERITPVWKRLNFTQKSTLRNLFRYKKRFIMTILGIGGCMGLMLVGFGIRDSITVVAQNQYVEIFMQDASVSVDVDASAADKQKLEDTISAYPGITEQMDAYEMSVTLNANDTDRTAYLYVPAETDKVFDYVRFRDRVTKESYPYPEYGVALAEKTADMMNVGIGDTITIQKGENETPVEVTVERIVENYVLHYAFMTPETYERLFGEEPAYNYIYIKYEDHSAENEREMGTLFMEQDACTGVSLVTELEDQILDMLAVLDLVIWVLIIAAALLAFVVLYNLNSINMTERKRELATLKVLGFRDMEVAMYVYRENIILTIIGIAAGAVLGSILHLFTILTVEVDLMMFGRVIGPQSYVICAVLTFGFSLIVNVVMYYHFRRIDMVESLKSVE